MPQKPPGAPPDAFERRDLVLVCVARHVGDDVRVVEEQLLEVGPEVQRRRVARVAVAPGPSRAPGVARRGVLVLVVLGQRADRMMSEDDHELLGLLGGGDRLLQPAELRVVEVALAAHRLALGDGVDGDHPHALPRRERVVGRLPTGRRRLLRVDQPEAVGVGLLAGDVELHVLLAVDEPPLGIRRHEERAVGRGEQRGGTQSAGLQRLQAAGADGLEAGVGPGVALDEPVVVAEGDVAADLQSRACRTGAARGP